MKKILLLTTGGTIACTKTENGFSPAEGVPKPLSDGLSDVETRALFSLDSTDLTPAHWRKLYETAQNACDSGKYGGIVILHGTDTLDYTAALLYHTLKTPIPVILTGAMTPLSEPDSDGMRNASDAMLAARDGRLHGVFAVFGGRVIAGNELVKRCSDKADAFRSFSGNDLGAVRDGAVTLFREPEPAEIFDYPQTDREIAVLKLSPFMTGAALSSVCASGAVLEGYGAGGLPEHLLPAAKKLTEKMPVVLTTPCIGGVNLREYEVGRRALECGIRDGGTCTTAAAAVRLFCGEDFKKRSPAKKEEKKP